jgi:hypothetical protein
MLLSDKVVNFYFEEMGASYGWIFHYAKRSWHGNWMRPCPIRDHYEEFHKMLTEFRPEPVDANAKAAMVDSEYQRAMIDPRHPEFNRFLTNY